MGFLLLAVGAGFIALLLLIIGSAFKGVKNEPSAVENQRKAAHASVQNEALRDAGSALLNARQKLYKIKNEEVRRDASQALDKAEKILTTLKKQPEDIRASHQFLNYYMPTLKVVLEKYLALEQSGVAIEDSTEEIRGYLKDISQAFDKNYDNLFQNDKLDLSVEMEAMQMAFKRDGLLSDSEILSAEQAAAAAFQADDLSASAVPSTEQGQVLQSH